MKEVKVYKALYFDLKINALKKYYSRINPKGAYRKIKGFLVEHDFSHEQYSGYHSKYKTTDLDIFVLIREMIIELPWIKKCVNHFEVTDLGVDYDLTDLFA